MQIKENINSIINGDNLVLLKNAPDNSIDSIITDVPYGLQDINALELIKENKNNTKGFMGQKWDVLPTIEMLKEFYRVLKTGGFLVTTFSPRQDLQTIFCYRLLEAGFDINFSPLYYCFASGFPKACDYSKMAQKSSGVEPEITKPTIEEAKYLEGLKSLQLKPAVEPIIIAQKPHNKAKYKQAIDWYQERKTLLDSGIKEEDLSLYTKNASGGVRIDDCRIPIENLQNEAGYRPNAKNHRRTIDNGVTSFSGINMIDGKVYLENCDEGYHNSNGRFPANILVADDCIDVERITKSSGGSQLKRKQNKEDIFFQKNISYQSNSAEYGFQDVGDLSRYFSLDSWTKKHYPELYKVAEKTLELEKNSQKISPILFLTKPHRGEKDAGLEGELKKTENEQRDEGQKGYDNPFKNRPRMVYNNHPTGKPLALFNYLIHLFSSENDIILDPFCGSGTTCISAVLTKRKYIGIEINENYCKISKERVNFWQTQKEIEKNSKLF